MSITTVVKEALDNGFQVEPKALDLIRSLQEKDVNVNRIIQDIIDKKSGKSSVKTITERDIDAALPSSIKESVISSTKKTRHIESKVEIIINTNDSTALLEGKDGFKSLFKSRYNKLLNIVSLRPSRKRLDKISSVVKGRKEGSRHIAGLVMNKKIQRNSVVLTLDDDTGILEVLAMDKKVIEDIKQVLLDSLVVVDIQFSKRGVPILRSIELPDVPERTPNVSSKQVYTIFTSDLHVGSRNFLSEEFECFIHWLKDRKKDVEIVDKIKYLIIAGDAIDGIGVYPGQENDLEVLDVEEQYIALSQLLEQIPGSIEIFIIPGNHDPVRQALPQPSIPRKYAKDLYNMSNVTMLGNPAYIRLHDVNILIYHGRSLDDVMATTPGFTFTRPAVAMKLLLRTRHLGPVYGKRNSVIPDLEDNLVIDEVPDIFHGGHIHTLDSENYRGTLILNSGSWQSQTPFQAKMGVVPTPGIIPIVDLSNHEVITKDFRQMSLNDI